MAVTSRRRKGLLLLAAGLVLGLAAGLALWQERPRGQPTADSLTTGRTALYDASAKRAFLQSLPPAERGKVVKLKSRWLVPGTDFEQKPGREQVFIQFRRWPTDAEKKRLSKEGLHLGDPLSGHSYRATLDAGAWERLKGRPEIEGVARVKLADKLHKPIHDLLDSGGAALVALEPAPGMDAIRSRLVRRFGRRARLHRGDIIISLNAPEIRELALRDEIAYVHHLGYIPIEHTPPALVPGPDNSDAADIHNVDDLHAGPYNLDGSGVRIGEVDGGYVRDTHEALTGRVILVETDSGMSWHATHVAGTIIGNPPGTPGALGMAPAATLYSYDFDSDLDGVGTVYAHDKVTHAADNCSIVVHNNSWGYVGGWEGGVWYGEGIFGDYDWYARQWDLVAALNPFVVICKSSGNDRNDTGAGPDPQDGTEHPTPGLTNPYYDCIANWGCSKNIISVGATDDASAITDFSSIGPADDGRIKPDLVANGDLLLSAYSDTDTSYAWASGTSMSCPVVSGISALVIQAWRAAHAGADPDAMVVKALLVQTAADLGHPGPDYVHGFGLVDAKAAVDLLQADAGGSNHIQQSSVANAAQQEYTLTAPGGVDLKVTLTWRDPAGASGADPAIVNDLDLELVAPDLSVHYPFKLDPADPPADATNAGKNAVDTVEQAVVTAAAAGTWTVRVKGTSVPSGPQSFVLVTSIASGTVIYVDASASAGADDGSSWGDAYLDLEDALTAAGNGDRIWVANGTYKPSAPGGRTSTFGLKSGVALYGGFASGETSLAQRNVAGNPAILSGDIGVAADSSDNSYHVVTGADNATIDGFTVTAGNADGAAPDNVGAGIDNQMVAPTIANCTLIDNSGFAGCAIFNRACSPTITGCTFTNNTATWYGAAIRNFNGANPQITDCTFTGNSSTTDQGGAIHNHLSAPVISGCTFTGNSAATNGGAMYNNSSSPQISNCSFTSCTADVDGGAIYNNSSSPTISNCSFSNNTADHFAGALRNHDNSNAVVTDSTFSGNVSTTTQGGAVHNNFSSPTFTGCTFSGNTAFTNGGAMYNDHASSQITSCTFSSNEAVYGGAIYNAWAPFPTISNCLFFDNTATLSGGALRNYDGASVILTNCTFAGNSATLDGGAIANLDGANPTLKDCILWSNSAGGAGDEIHDDNATATVTYSCVQGGWAGAGNIDADPLFADAAADDYHLKSVAGRWTPGGWVTDAVHSPCIDAGDPASSYGNEPSPNGGRVNMGAYGNTAQASKSCPKIALSTSSLSPSVTVGGNATSQSFTVSNSGASTLNYTISDDAAWLDCAPNSGDSTGEADTINVDYTTSALAVGTYNAIITITDANASNNPQTIGVTLTVNAPPTIGLDTATLSPSCTKTQDAAAQTFEVWNAGGGTLNYAISDNAAWLSCAPSPGDSTGEHDTITVTYDTSGLTVGTYNATITVTAPGVTNSPQTIAVTLTVNSQQSGGGGGGGSCALAAGSDPMGWALPYLALVGGWLLSRLRRRRRKQPY